MNEAPTDIGLVGTTVAENAANGTQVGSLSTTDPDTGETFKYALVDNAGGRFDVQGGKIIVANGALLDFEGQKSHVIVVEVTDKGGTGLSFQKQFTISLTNENEAPTSVTLNGAGTVVENAPDNLVVGTLTGADPDGNNTLTFSLADDAGGRFKIVGNQLQVANGKLLDFEGGQLEHTVKVRATDPGGLFVEKAFTFTVTNANEAPTALDLLGSFVAQQAESGTPRASRLTLPWRGRVGPQVRGGVNRAKREPVPQRVRMRFAHSPLPAAAAQRRPSPSRGGWARRPSRPF